MEFHIGQFVEHPKFGRGTIINISEQDSKTMLTIRFKEEEKTLIADLAPLEVVGEDENIKLKELFRDVIRQELGGDFAKKISESVQQALQQEMGNATVELGSKWNGGEIVIKPGRGDLKEKVIPIDSFFHKIVLIRDRLRVLEQHINSNKKLSDEEKVDLQQYITRCYGSLTTFNVLFANSDDWFIGQSQKREKE